jgi:hypothetical protein
MTATSQVGLAIDLPLWVPATAYDGAAQSSTGDESHTRLALERNRARRARIIAQNREAA